MGKSGGSLTTIALANIPNFDVHQEVQETLTSLGPGLAYSRLLRLRTGPEEEFPQPSLLLECELCERWEVLDGLLTYRFRLREGVRWHNVAPVSGREVTAEDVVFSYERQRTSGFANAPLLRNMLAIEVEDQHTLKITLNPGFPDADFLVSLADGHTKVVAQEVVKASGGLSKGPVIGSGPWIWKSTQEDVGSVFEKNPDYFEDGLPFADQLVIRVFKGGEENRVAAFVTGEVDVYRIPPEALGQLNRTGSVFNSFISKQGGTGLILAMNISSPPFDNLQVRKAVLRALDPWNDLRTIWADQGFVSLGMPVERPDWLLTREEMRRDYFADPTEAAEMLSRSGMPMPVRFDFILGDFGDTHIRQGVGIEKQLADVGFAPSLKLVNPTQYAETVWRDKKYQLSLGRLPQLRPPTVLSLPYYIPHRRKGTSCNMLMLSWMP